MSVMLHARLADVPEPPDLADVTDDAEGTAAGDADDGALKEEDRAKQARQEEARAQRRLVAAQLMEILGYSLQCCVKALEIAKDDKEKAASIIMDSPDEIWHAMELDQRQEVASRNLPPCAVHAPATLCPYPSSPSLCPCLSVDKLLPRHTTGAASGVPSGAHRGVQWRHRATVRRCLRQRAGLRPRLGATGPEFSWAWV